MANTNVKILQPPTPAMLKDENAHYRFLLALYERTGGAEPNGADLTNLKVSVPELNMLSGVNVGKSIQAQLDEKITGVVVP